ncbi:MAG: hypothetical protein J5I28_11740 [Acidimicrobiales bacterium]|jgi:hypothetical protein|nr:hypothetical protein [Acidimicrobiales bacterium]HLV89962.1 hypothetical protein [Acidimicrobiia bacterium]
MTPPPIPPDLVSTRDALHQIAYFVLAPARFRRTGRMGLVPTRGGFGTPSLDGRTLRVDGDQLVDERPEGVASVRITTMGDAVSFFDEPYVVDWFDDFGDKLPPYPLDRDLGVSVDAARFVGEIFALGARAIEGFAAVVPGGITETWIWPEHFDIATEAGDEMTGGKASFGASPGDHAHDEPYFYVSAWGEIDRAETFWNDEAFNGASLAYRDVMVVDDPVGRVVDFFMEGFRLLNPA